MKTPLTNFYTNKIWDIYARAIALITIIVIVVAFIMAGRSILKIYNPQFMLSASLHEKYKSNESYTKFGALKKGLTQEQISTERTSNYEKLLRMEQRSANQNLAHVFLALVIVGLLNGVLVISCRKNNSS